LAQDEHRAQYTQSEGKCCFNHVVGLPVKNKREFLLFDYERLSFDKLFGNSQQVTSKIGKNVG
jgi:hypothetical protein